MDENPLLKAMQERSPDLFAAGQKADVEFAEALSRLAEIAKEIIESKNKLKPPDIRAKLEADFASCCASATAWIKSNYTMVPGLAEEYGKSWIDGARVKETIAVTSWAAALSDPKVASALKEAMIAIAKAGVSIPLQMLFLMLGPDRRNEAVTATENVKNTVAAAKTVIMAL